MKSRNLMAAAYSVISTPRDGDLAAYGGKGPFDGSTRLGALSNVGYQQARFNLATMKRAGLQSPDRVARRRAGPGVRLAQRHRGQRGRGPRRRPRLHRRRLPRSAPTPPRPCGSTSSATCGSGIPEWRAAGQTSRAEALRRCGPERMFQGGDGVLGQWVEAGRDMNVTCPGTSAEMPRWFHQY